MSEGREPDAPEADAAALEEFIRLFDTGQFFASHEVLEKRWLVTRNPFQQGLIILASAFVHRDRGNRRGFMRQLEKARRYFQACPPFRQGLDVDGLLARLDGCLARLAQESHSASDAALEAPRLYPLLRR